MKNNLLFMAFCLCLIVLSCKKTATEPEIPPSPTAPVVKITSVSNNVIVLDSVLIEIDATDDKGITKVEIYIDNKTDSSKTLRLKPYNYTWKTPQTEDSSKHSLYAKAYDADGNTTTTEIMTINVQKFQPPSLLQIMSMTDELIKLKWRDNSAGETGFDIEISLGANNYTLLKSVASNTDSVEIAGAYVTDSTYYFRVKAKKDNKFAVSTEAVYKLIFPAPTTLTIISMTTSQLSLSWVDNSSFETRFEIEQMANSGSFSLVKTVGANITATTITAVFDSSITYSFRLRAVTTTNKSQYSNTQSYNIAAVAAAATAGMLFVTSGTFTMGSENSLDYGASPSHTVTISDYYISTTEIRWGIWDTVYQWGINNGYTDLVGGRKGSTNGDAQHPVTNINWYDIVKWCNARSQKEGLTPVYYTSTTFTSANIYKTGTIDLQNTMVNWIANGYRLPTESEWEYAAQGGAKRQNPPYIYSGSNTLDGVAWYSTNSSNNTHQVGGKTANELGLYDMTGNVWEWCWDWDGSYSSAAQTNPKGATTGTGRLLRGGSFNSLVNDCRVALRYDSYPNNSYGSTPNERYYNFGFRCVRTK